MFKYNFKYGGSAISCNLGGMFCQIFLVRSTPTYGGASLR